MREGTGTILAAAELRRKFTAKWSGAHLSMLYTNVADLQEGPLAFQYSCCDEIAEKAWNGRRGAVLHSAQVHKSRAADVNRWARELRY